MFRIFEILFFIMFLTKVGYEGLPRTSTKAYLLRHRSQRIKSFIILSVGVDVVKPFIFVTGWDKINKKFVLENTQSSITFAIKAGSLLIVWVRA